MLTSLGNTEGLPTLWSQIQIYKPYKASALLLPPSQIRPDSQGSQRFLGATRVTDERLQEITGVREEKNWDKQEEVESAAERKINGEVAELQTRLWDKCSYLQASNASPPLRPKLHSESDPLSVCFPKPLVTPAKNTQSEPECRNPPPLTHAAVWGSHLGRAQQGGMERMAGPSSWEMGLGWWREPDKGLGEMLARAVNRHCIYLPILLGLLEGK